MTVQDALHSSAISRADTEVLLAHVLQKNRTWLLAHPEARLSPDEEATWNQFRSRREQGEPVAYIIGSREFYGRQFFVDPRVLVPRPSTEGLVTLALDILKHPRSESIDLDSGITGYANMWGSLDDVQTIVDIGTGSGCIAITIARERPDLQLIATDVSADAIEVARKNAEHHHVIDRVDFRIGDALDPIQDLQKPFLLVTNPPYIPIGNDIMPDVRDHEPHIALFGGAEGTDIAARIAEQAREHPYCRGIVLECETQQVMAIAKLLSFED